MCRPMPSSRAELRLKGGPVSGGVTPWQAPFVLISVGRQTWFPFTSLTFVAVSPRSLPADMSPGGGETLSVGWRKGLQHQHSVPQAEGVCFLLLIGALGGHWPGTPGQGVALYLVLSSALL